MAGPSGDQSQTRNSATSADPLPTSSEAGCDCQIFRNAALKPPDTSPTKTTPEARWPQAASSQQLCGFVRFWIANPSAVYWTSLYASQTAQSLSSFCPAAGNDSLLGRRLPSSCRAKRFSLLPATVRKRLPVAGFIGSDQTPSPSPVKRTCRLWTCSRIGTA